MDYSVNDKAGIRLEEYNGQYSLVCTRIVGDKIYPQYATYQMGKDKHAKKDWPVRVVLGNKDEAIRACKWMWSKLKDEDVPF